MPKHFTSKKLITRSPTQAPHNSSSLVAERASLPPEYHADPQLGATCALCGRSKGMGCLAPWQRLAPWALAQLRLFVKLKCHTTADVHIRCAQKLSLRLAEIASWCQTLNGIAAEDSGLPRAIYELFHDATPFDVSMARMGARRTEDGWSLAHKPDMKE